MKTARQIAVEALGKVNGSKGYSNIVIDKALEQSGLDLRDAAFATALFYGVLERMLTLDHCIAGFSKTPVEKLTPQVREILRVSLYQILYMDSVPDSAAVNEAVNLTRVFRKESAGGFVNGVLRAFLRSGKRVPRMAGSRADQLSIQYSCPAWLVQLWLDSYGEENTEGILKTSLGRPPVYIRVNTLKTTADALSVQLEEEGAVVRRDEMEENCLRVSGTGDVTALPAFQEGLFHVQDKSSQLCVKALDARPGMRVLDICAAPGGKSFTAAQWMHGEGELLAMDLYRARAALVAEGAQRLDIGCIAAKEGDASRYNSKLGLFDRVLCDAPCSGLGIIRRKPEIKYKNPEELGEIPQLQYNILSNSANYVKKGGILLYSTCTLNPGENEGVVERFLAEHRDFAPCRLPQSLGSSGHTVTLFPHQGDTDGFFISTMERVRHDDKD
ncbi:16S rRNA (cytosine(967)-C(5))-methyltransferase RsmB [Merdimmobilis hominis]|uniref:16S rRNA (cytosine(967)-C(5))-methyltransferase RsmB n=1 Tax=Merdimmobilis hominis TaxID=2897707 RepID=UPI0006C82162|nr:16S rRNA (cytosine(967)-C(5))-methyltransferase RsmB [Merdimmobilis hominis]PWL58335.1 MAG: 16S rRNA (cytosine(967)-C(5))-methyltransferase RsmB [Oscillospiraceae bacterium]